MRILMTQAIHLVNIIYAPHDSVCIQGMCVHTKRGSNYVLT